MNESFNKKLAESLSKHWDYPALSDLNGATLKYSDVAASIAKIHIYYETIGIKPGEKIALCGKNSVKWAVAFLATVTYGAVAVPILNEFKTENIHHLVNHSDSVLLFVDESIMEHLDVEQMPVLQGIFLLGDYTLAFSRNEKLTVARNEIDKLFGEHYPDGFSRKDIHYCEDKPDQLMLINYTSGSTGFSKGVMLTYGNLMSNAQFAIDNIPYFHPGDGILCMLPLAHMYGLLVELLFPLFKGTHVSFLGRVPSPKILLDAFAHVKPKLIITVPLVVEKIVKGRIFPVIKKPLMRLLLLIPGVNNRIYKKIRKQMIDAFGGNLCQMVIGGAALSDDVERFLRRIKFPYTVGYGMTECAPLIAYAPWDEFKAHSCGRTVDRMEVRIDSPDPEHIPGELWVRGDNVMQGYYKNPEATEAVFRDGWMNTGDMCTQDSDGFIYIRGRNKTMILGPSGQNIYPEEIEQKLNNMLLVNESIVVDRDGALIALVHPDYDEAKRLKISDGQIPGIMDANLVALNKEMPTYSKVKAIEIVNDTFEKTPKHSIKRYLYK